MRATQNPCRGCGSPGDVNDPATTTCRNCPPVTCDRCGTVDHINTPCACWVGLTGMPLADLKAIFAREGLSLTIERED